MALRKQDLIDMWETKMSNASPQLKVRLLDKTGRGGQSAARDYIHALCLISEMEKLNVDYNSFTTVEECLRSIHPLTRFRWKRYSPCLAYRYDELKPAEQTKLFDDRNWVCFSRGTKVKMADMSYKNIEDIQPGEYVMGWDSNGFRPTRVIKSKSPIDKKRTYTVDFGTHKVVATEDHQWWTPEGWKETKDLVEVCTQTLSKTQMAMLYGHILGDGHIDKSGNLQSAQCVEHEEYIRWLYNKLGVTRTEFSYYKVKGIHSTVRVQSMGGKFKDLRIKFYQNEGKVIPQDVEEYLSPELFAVWYQDDGTLMKSNTVHPNARLIVNQFSQDQIANILNYLQSQGFNFKYLDYKDVKMISFDWRSTEKFCEWISPYLCSCMEYKSTCMAKEAEVVSAVGTQSVKVYKTNHGAINVFCISTETENFVLASGEMVHNCTEKMNGSRCWLMYYKGDVRLYSRNYSDRDCGLNEYHLNVYHDIKKTDDIFVVDTEIMFEPGVDIRGKLEDFGIETNSKLESMCALLQMNTPQAISIQKEFKDKYNRDLIAFRMIAPLYYNGVSYINKSLGDGMDVYDNCIEFGKSLGFNLKPIKRCSGSSEEKKIFLETIINEGGEGVVFHNRKGVYCTSDNRNKNSFVKLKRSLKSTIGMDDTVDGFITGFKMSSDKAGNAGLIGSLEASIYILEPDGRTTKHVAAYLPNITLDMKKKITIVNPETGEVTMSPDMYGLVVEMDAQSFSAQSERLTHPRLLRFRTDKSADECIYTREWITSQQDGKGL